METNQPTNLADHRAGHRQTMSAFFLALQQANGASRRKAPRVRLALPLTLHMDEWETDTHTFDISAGGFSFLAGSFPTQERFRFVIELHPGNVVRGHARAVTAVRSGSGYRVCVSFSGLTVAARAAVADRVIETLEAENDKEELELVEAELVA